MPGRGAGKKQTLGLTGRKSKLKKAAAATAATSDFEATAPAVPLKKPAAQRKGASARKPQKGAFQMTTQ